MELLDNQKSERAWDIDDYIRLKVYMKCNEAFSSLSSWIDEFCWQKSKASSYKK
jgi:hypothetical protein